MTQFFKIESLRKQLKSPSLPRETKRSIARRLAKLTIREVDKTYKAESKRESFPSTENYALSYILEMESAARLFITGKRPRKALKTYKKELDILASIDFAGMRITQDDWEDQLSFYIASKLATNRINTNASRVARAIGVEYDPCPFKVTDQFERLKSNYDLAQRLGESLEERGKREGLRRAAINEFLRDTGIPFSSGQNYAFSFISPVLEGILISQTRLGTQATGEGESIKTMKFVERKENPSILEVVTHPVGVIYRAVIPPEKVIGYLTKEERAVKSTNGN